MNKISKNIIFLHGPSGAGKGEMQRQIEGGFKEKGYKVMTVSSGDLFRLASKNPEIASQMRSGKYIDTLDVIKPAIKEKFKEFLKDFIESDGKAVIIWDGLVRRGEFTREDGSVVPSQIAQINKDFEEVYEELVFDKQIFDIKNTVQEARHITIDIVPKDAENQIIGRAKRELDKVKEEIRERLRNPFAQNDIERLNQVFNEFPNIYEMLSGTLTRREAAFLSVLGKQVRTKLTSAVGIKSESSFKNIFAALGIKTEVRDDDIDPEGRIQRGRNYLIPVEENVRNSRLRVSSPKEIYVPGFAAQALIDGLNYGFENGKMHTNNIENLTVIPNGKGRGINLKKFQNSCKKTFEEIFERDFKDRGERELAINNR